MFAPVGPQTPGLVEELLRRLTERFGGATAFSRAPARGEWKDEAGRRERDDVVVIEVMAEGLDAAFWRELQRELEERLNQDEVLIRASRTAKLTPVRSANGDP